jgi:hypothetical protein
LRGKSACVASSVDENPPTPTSLKLPTAHTNPDFISVTDPVAVVYPGADAVTVTVPESTRPCRTNSGPKDEVFVTDADAEPAAPNESATNSFVGSDDVKVNTVPFGTGDEKVKRSSFSRLLPTANGGKDIVPNVTVTVKVGADPGPLGCVKPGGCVKLRTVDPAYCGATEILGSVAGTDALTTVGFGPPGVAGVCVAVIGMLTEIPGRRLLELPHVPVEGLK